MHYSCRLFMSLCSTLGLSASQKTLVNSRLRVSASTSVSLSKFAGPNRVSQIINKFLHVSGCFQLPRCFSTLFFRSLNDHPSVCITHRFIAQKINYLLCQSWNLWHTATHHTAQHIIWVKTKYFFCFFHSDLLSLSFCLFVSRHESIF